MSSDKPLYLHGQTQGCSKGARDYYRKQPMHLVRRDTAFRLSEKPLWIRQIPFEFIPGEREKVLPNPTIIDGRMKG